MATATLAVAVSAPASPVSFSKRYTFATIVRALTAPVKTGKVDAPQTSTWADGARFM